MINYAFENLHYRLNYTDFGIWLQSEYIRQNETMVKIFVSIAI